jgi:hypothetical protein
VRPSGRERAGAPKGTGWLEQAQLERAAVLLAGEAVAVGGLRGRRGRRLRFGGRLDGESGANPKAPRRAGEVSRANAAAAYADLAPVIAGMLVEGLSLRRIAGRLNAEGHTTRMEKAWNAVQVRGVLLGFIN